MSRTVAIDETAFYSRLQRARAGDLHSLATRDRADARQLVEFSTVHGFDTLLWVLSAELSAGESLRSALEERVMLEVARAQSRAHHAANVLGALARVGIQALLLKGTALACYAYEKPWHRPSADIDLLVAPSDAMKAREVLAADLEPAVQMCGKFVCRFSFTKMP